MVAVVVDRARPDLVDDRGGLICIPGHAIARPEYVFDLPEFMRSRSSWDGAAFQRLRGVPANHDHAHT